MNDLALFMNQSKNYKCSIIEYPSGRFGFVGSIPSELCELKTNKIGQEYFASKVYNTRLEAEIALNSIK
jgi:hypothetical protein